MAIPSLLSLPFLLPYTAHKLSFDNALRGLLGMPRRILLIGQSNATAAALLQNIASEAQALALLGEGTMLIGMWRAAKANADLGAVIDVLALPDPVGGGAATGTIIIGDTATNSGELAVHIAGRRIAVPVVAGEAAAVIADRLLAAIDDTPGLPVNASLYSSGGDLGVALECNWTGSTGNEIDVRINHYQSEQTPLGLTVTVDAMAGGAGTPVLTNDATLVRGYRATEIVLPYHDSTSLNSVIAEQELRWGCTNKQDGQVITVKRGALNDHLTWLADRNSQQSHSVHVRADRSNPWDTAAMLAANIESSAAIDAAVPFQGIKLVGYAGARAQDAFGTDEANAIAQAHGGTLETAGEDEWAMSRMFNHYKRNSAGGADASARDLCWVKLASYWRWVHVTEFETKYRNGWKLAEYVTEPLPGQKIMTKDIGEEIMLSLYEVFMDAGLFQNMPHYKASLKVEIDGANGKLKVIDEPVMVTQFYQTEITSNLIAGHVG